MELCLIGFVETPLPTVARARSVALFCVACLVGSVSQAFAQSRAPLGANIKGLQVQMIDDALALGIKHAALNVSLTAMIDLDGRPESFRWQSGGQTYFFSRGDVEGVPVRPLSSA